MKPIRLYFLAIAFLLLSVPGFAQGKRGQRMQNLESARTAFMNEKMQLTPEQAQKFWPVYNEFDAKRKALRQQSRGLKGRNFETMTDAQLKEGISNMFELRQKELNLEKEYAENFQKIISVRQLATMYKAEKEFTRVLLQKLNQRKDEE